MTKAEHLRLVTWRLKTLRHAASEDRSVAHTCRCFGISRKTYYKGARRFRSHGEAGLSDRPRAPQRSPRATPPEVVSKILYLRQQYHFGAGRIAAYLRRFHQVAVARVQSEWTSVKWLPLMRSSVHKRNAAVETVAEAKGKDRRVGHTVANATHRH
jgi:transposase